MNYPFENLPLLVIFILHWLPFLRKNCCYQQQRIDRSFYCNSLRDTGTNLSALLHSPVLRKTAATLTFTSWIWYVFDWSNWVSIYCFIINKLFTMKFRYTPLRNGRATWAINSDSLRGGKKLHGRAFLPGWRQSSVCHVFKDEECPHGHHWASCKVLFNPKRGSDPRGTPSVSTAFSRYKAHHNVTRLRNLLTIRSPGRATRTLCSICSLCDALVRQTCFKKSCTNVLMLVKY